MEDKIEIGDIVEVTGGDRGYVVWEEGILRTSNNIG